MPNAISRGLAVNANINIEKDAHMATQFVWIAGPSSVGKRTTIDKCVSDPEWCREFFSLGDCDVVEARYGCATANNPDSPNDTAIADIAEKADSASRPAAILIFWQAIYRTAVPYLKERRPDDHHALVHLHRDHTGHLESFIDDYFHVDG